MEALFQSQEIIAESIEKIGINFNKDSASRKTSDYIKKRVDSLDEFWMKFQANHTDLLDYDIEKTIYATTNAFARVKSKYEFIRNMILTYQAPPKEGESKGSPSKSDELIMQQATNFRALSRLIRNINIETISEKWEIEDKLQMLQTRWKTIDDLHWQIDNLLTDCNMDYELDFNNNENRYEAIKRQLHQKLNSTTSQNQSLPKIEIPTFSGNYTQWPTFLDLYRETIHNNMSLSKTQKMQHLKGKLRGEAERLVQHLTVSADNYETCWDILTHRYDNKQLLFTKQMQTFMSQPPVQHQSAFELKRLHDTSVETIHAILNLGVDTTTWDPFLVHILTGKLDTDTYTSYMEARKAPRELPTFQEFIDFLEGKFTALEPINKKKPLPNATPAAKPIYAQKDFSRTSPNKNLRAYPRTYHVSAERFCPLCKTNHVLMNCKVFHDMSADVKLKTLSQLNVCQNCLYSHEKQCNSKKTCRVCNLPHHTSLHDTFRDAKQAPPPSGQSPQLKFSQTKPPSQPSTNHVAGNYNEVLLATLQLKVKAVDGTYIVLRCLLDQGSQINLITESAAQRLGLPRMHENASVFGIGTSNNQSNGTVRLNCTSLCGDYNFTTDALVMTKVLNNLPNCSFEKQQWPHLQGIYLADPDYNISRPVDVLLDAGVYAEIATGCLIRGPIDAPVALQTRVGWVLLGNMKTYNCHALIHNLEEISKFWELEDITTSNNIQMTSEEARCETLYADTTRRLNDGRYVVKIPMTHNYEHKLGISKSQAVAQFRQLEKRLNKNDDLCTSYKAFIHEYISLKHMKLCTVPREPNCFLPHHGVLQPDSATTKLRVVFNASAKTSSGYSLNQLMEDGPNLQQDIQTLILRWRSYQYVYTADIEKFYRQIMIAEEDQHLQKIVWRDSEHEPIQEYQLCTVTYGTKSAPFLAMRTIKQLIIDDGQHYPLAAEILDSQLYVDDLLAGSNSLEEAREAQTQLINMLKGGGFNIRKWASNNLSLLEHLPEDLISQNMFNFQLAESNKTLGITWNPQTDNFTFRHDINTDRSDVTTKRTLLSEVSKLYDPLGWLSPVTMKTKLMFQQTWKLTADWDSPLPTCVQREWEQFHKELPFLRDISIPRWIGSNLQNIELHGFSDASEKGYGCVIYCISMGIQGEKVIEIVAGKNKLAPINKPITLPRLELCGALLLAQLMKKVIDSIKAQTVTVRGWTDSMVVLGWLQAEPSRWKTYVSNRVTQITEIMPPKCWSHVKSEDNPADCASRGLFPSQLVSHSLWWEGPAWLKNNERPIHHIFKTSEEERKQPQVGVTQIHAPLIKELLHVHSSMARVTRALSWIVRFIKNARDKNNATHTKYLTPLELRSTLIMLVKTVQNNLFASEISQLRKQKSVSSASKIINLSPILDQDGILRVGGRLRRADLDQNQIHPMILPNNHRLTELLIKQAHITTLHGGARLTLTYLRTKFWIIGGMKTVKRYVTKCVKCHRYSKQNNYQLMADLPKPRVNPSRPFTHTGVDFTGQVEIKANKGRGIKTTKSYIAVFICLCTKAIHLELVSDLSTAAFISALKRLCARRGTPRHMYSDNGTNFVGAAKTLEKERIEALRLYVNNEFLDFSAHSGIEWHFNAPSWPTAGGLWEAAVKSMKHHLKRVLGEQRLTYEEFATLLTQIEACLNSRPLVAITEDPEDLNCLTPGHFLVGGPILGLPLDTDNNVTSLTIRWRQTENMLKDFWKRWSATYLQTLQTRSKWLYPTPDLKLGDIVLVRDEHIPPARWLMGRITDTHPGADGRVRVVTLKTKTSSSVKRPVTKLSRLPIDCTSEEADTQETPTRRLRSKKGSFVSYLCTLLLFTTMCISPTASQPVNITTLNPEKLIYFDKLTDMKIIQDKWTMVVYYNMSSYWRGIDNLEKYVNHFYGLCTKEVAYQALMTQFQHEINELKHYNDLLQTEHGRRTKRGFVDGVGYAANTLFGILDQHFAEKYNTDIKRIQLNENHLLELYKNHTSIIEGEYNLIKRNEEVFNRQFTAIDQHFKQMQNSVRQDNFNTQYITVTALAANMILSNLRHVQQLLLDLVTDIRNGRVDTHLLKPEEFEKQLNIISRQIPSGLTLPCRNSYECTRLMYKISRVHVRLTYNFLIFEVKIPLVTTELYELSRVLPIKKNRGMSVVHVVPRSEYLAIDQKRNLLLTITSQDMELCLHATEHMLLCNLNLPIYNIKTTHAICEAQIIGKKAATTCRTVVSNCTIEWTQLHSRGSWLFTCCEECSTSIYCPGEEITSQALRNTGIVTLPDGCMLQGEDLVIHSHFSLHSEVHIQEDYDYEPYVPQSGINKYLAVNNITGYNFTPESHYEQFKTLKEKIDAVKSQQEVLNVQTDDIHHYVMYAFMSVCIMAVGVWIILRKYQQQRNQQGNHEEIELANPVTNSDVTSTGDGDFSARTSGFGARIDRATSPMPHGHNK